MTSLSRLVAVPLVFAAAGGVFPVATSAAREIVVTDTADDLTLDGLCTLREALIAANYDIAYDACPAGEPEPVTDTVLLGPGTYTLGLVGTDEDGGLTGDLDVRFSASIRGSGTTQTTLDGAELDRVLHLRMDAPSSTFHLEAVTVRGGVTPDSGGAVLVERGGLVASNVVFTRHLAGASGGAIEAYPGTSVTLTDTTLTASSALYGGALAAVEASVIVERASIADNYAVESGAGLYIAAGSLDLRAAIIERNVLGTTDASRGAGMEVRGLGYPPDSPAVVVRDASFRNNHPTAIASDSVSRLTLVGVSISDSQGRGIASSGDALVWRGRIERNAGGGIVNRGRMQLVETAIRGNTAANAGGVENHGLLTVLRSEVTDNDAHGDLSATPAGGIYNGPEYGVGSTALRVVDSTLSGNSSASGGGVTAAHGGWTSIRGSTLSANSGGEAGDIAVHAAGTQLEIQNSIVADGCLAAQGALTISLGGNIESGGDTCALDQGTDRSGVASSSLALEPLSDGGGATRSHGLGRGSIAIDTAIDEACSPTDQRGYARADGHCDVGAHEAGAPPCTGRDSDGDGIPDACDACPSVQDPLQADFDADGTGDACDPCNDFDQDGYGSPASLACPGGPSEDCDDGSPGRHPGGVEIPGNGLDDDCNSLTPYPGCAPQALEGPALPTETRSVAMLDPSPLLVLGWVTRRSRFVRRNGRTLRGWMLGLALATIAFPGHATTIAVTSMADDLAMGPNGTCTLREAILAANTDAAVDACPAGIGPDTVALPTGEFVLAIAGTHEDGNLTGDLDIWSDLVLQGAGDSATIIDAASLDTVVHVLEGTVRLVDVKLQRGVGDVAGGIRFDRGSLTLERTTVAGNEVQLPVSDPSRGAAGGILSRGTLEVIDSTIYGNHWGGTPGPIVAGGIDARAGTLYVRGSTFDSNHFRALWLEDVPTVIESSAFRSNALGAIAALRSPVTIVDSIIEDHAHNTETDFVSRFDGADLHATRVVFRNNVGNAVRLVASTGAVPTTATIEDCTFENNRATPGAAIWSFARDVHIRGSTFDRNSSPSSYGAITHDGSGSMTIENSTFSDNTGNPATSIAVLGSSSMRLLHTSVVETISMFTPSLRVVGTSARLDIGNSLVVGTCGNGSGTRLSLGGNVESPGDSCGFAAPADRVKVPKPRLGPLFSWGGTTQTHVLLPGSAALHAGRDELCLPTDQRGTPRPQGLHCDAGSFERACDGEDLDGDGLSGSCDMCPSVADPEQSDVDFDGLGDACDPCADLDGDGYGLAGSSGCPAGEPVDCDDTDASVNPGATELPANGIDDDCNPLTPLPTGCTPAIRSAGAAVAGEAGPGASSVADPMLVTSMVAALLLRTRRAGPRR